MGIDMGDALAPWHIIVLLVVLVLLFGSRRLPGAAKSLGESMHIFKRSVQGLHPDEDAQPYAAPNSSQTAAAPQPANTLPSAAPPAGIQGSQDTQQQLQDLQRQVQDLQRQGQQTSQPF